MASRVSKAQIWRGPKSVAWALLTRPVSRHRETLVPKAFCRLTKRPGPFDAKRRSACLIHGPMDFASSAVSRCTPPIGSRGPVSYVEVSPWKDGKDDQQRW